MPAAAIVMITDRSPSANRSRGRSRSPTAPRGTKRTDGQGEHTQCRAPAQSGKRLAGQFGWVVVG